MEHVAASREFLNPAPLRVPLVLASASPRRAELLRRAGYTFLVMPSETPEPEQKPAVVPVEIWPAVLALIKARDVAARRPDAITLGADTIVEYRGNIINKPRDQVHAREILMALSDTTHRVITGIALLCGEHLRFASAISVCRMARLSADFLAEYLRSGQWRGRAGAYGIQDLDTQVSLVSGEWSNVVGLPMELLRSELLSMDAVTKR